ncbi:MAG: IS4 family transposase [Akkermansiaceae bacterium]|nr:IS4 family transposase [Verrucomicrobiales bacterium]
MPYDDVPADAIPEADFDEAFDFLFSLVDLRKADQMMPLGPAAIYTASVVLWLLVFQRLNRNCPLWEAVKHLIDTAPQLCPNNKRIREMNLSSGTGTYSGARQRLTPEVTQWFADAVSTSIINTTPTLGNQRVFLIDGTTITLAPEKALREAFPPASNQHGAGVWPVALLVITHELQSGAALRPEIGPMYGPEAVSETVLARACLQRLPPNSIVLADANFGIFSMSHAIRQAGHSCLLRLTKQRFVAMRKQATLVDDEGTTKTWSLLWQPSARDRQSNPHLLPDSCLQVLIHEVQVHAELTLWLVTTLGHTALECMDLYGCRGNVETDIRNFKVVLETETIRATSVAMFHKELLASVVAYNLVVQFRQKAANQIRLPIRRLSFTGVWTTYRLFLLNAMPLSPVQWRERYAKALHYAMRDKLPNRPGRSYERCVYPRRPKSNHFEKRTPQQEEIPNKSPK